MSKELPHISNSNLHSYDCPSHSIISDQDSKSLRVLNLNSSPSPNRLDVSKSKAKPRSARMSPVRSTQLTRILASSQVQKASCSTVRRNRCTENRAASRSPQTSRSESILQQAFQEKEAIYKQEILRLNAELNLATQAQQKLEISNRAYILELEKLKQDATFYVSNIDNLKSCVSYLSNTLTHILCSLLNSDTQQSELGIDVKKGLKLQILDLLSFKLQEISTQIGLNLEEERNAASHSLSISPNLPEVSNMPQEPVTLTNFKPDCEASKLTRKPARQHPEHSPDRIAPSIQESKSLHPLNPFRQTSKDDQFKVVTEDYHTLRKKVRERIRRKCQSMSDQPLVAVAKYDFHGEQDGDLKFERGDKIEIVMRSDSGWWLGKLNNMIGSFPCNYVELLTSDLTL
jgi:hypothetical protein